VIAGIAAAKHPVDFPSGKLESRDRIFMIDSPRLCRGQHGEGCLRLEQREGWSLPLRYCSLG
jgi:hypothetical protein